MRKYLALIAAGSIGGVILAGCHNDQGQPPSPPPAPSATAFEPYAANLVETATCENNAPVETNSIIFSFAADQDTAPPRDVSTTATACKS